MKQFIAVIATLLTCSFCYADTGSLSLKELGSVWKTYRHISAKQDKNDITMVYGGQDISNRRHITPPSSIA